MFLLCEESQQYLLKLARQTLRLFLESGQRPEIESPPEELLPKRGAFVTLHRGQALRGCIGYVIPMFPLCQTVMECAISAATEDPRFAPLSAEELPEINIEISVLSPIEEIQQIEQIEVGTHGLVVSHKGRRGLLLPQVPIEYGWDRQRFLEETCRKAGLPTDAWRKGAKLEYFTAFVFGEARKAVEDQGSRAGD